MKKYFLRFLASMVLITLLGFMQLSAVSFAYAVEGPESGRSGATGVNTQPTPTITQKEKTAVVSLPPKAELDLKEQTQQTPLATTTQDQSGTSGSSGSNSGKDTTKNDDTSATSQQGNPSPSPATVTPPQSTSSVTATPPIAPAQSVQQVQSVSQAQPSPQIPLFTGEESSNAVQTGIPLQRVIDQPLALAKRYLPKDFYMQQGLAHRVTIAISALSALSIVGGILLLWPAPLRIGLERIKQLWTNLMHKPLTLQGYKGWAQ